MSTQAGRTQPCDTYPTERYDMDQLRMREATFEDFFTFDESAVMFVVVSIPTTSEQKDFTHQSNAEAFKPEPVRDIDSETLRKNVTCVICHENLKSMMYMPCRHLCVCKKCCKSYREYSNRCALCNKEFHDIVNVYAYN